MALKSVISMSDVVDEPKECPECKKTGFLGFINDSKGIGLVCDNCGTRYEFVAEPKLKEVN